MEEENPQVRASVAENLQAIDNWTLFWKRTVAYTGFVLRFKYGLTSEKGLDGKTAEDLAEEVIEKLLTGKRNWNRQKHPDLFSQVKSSIDSHVNNFISQKRLLESSISYESADNGTNDSYDENELLDYSIKILKSLNASDEEIILFQCNVDGLLKPREIAEELGISVTEVYNIKKRLNRKLPELQNNLRKYGI
jgi:RNA polymerase sigma factor (sigma-70 family)